MPIMKITYNIEEKVTKIYTKKLFIIFLFNSQRSTRTKQVTKSLFQRSGKQKTKNKKFARSGLVGGSMF